MPLSLDALVQSDWDAWKITMNFLDYAHNKYSDYRGVLKIESKSETGEPMARYIVVDDNGVYDTDSLPAGLEVSLIVYASLATMSGVFMGTLNPYKEVWKGNVKTSGVRELWRMCTAFDLSTKKWYNFEDAYMPGPYTVQNLPGHKGTRDMITAMTPPPSPSSKALEFVESMEVFKNCNGKNNAMESLGSFFLCVQDMGVPELVVAESRKKSEIFDTVTVRPNNSVEQPIVRKRESFVRRVATRLKNSMPEKMRYIMQHPVDEVSAGIEENIVDAPRKLRDGVVGFFRKLNRRADEIRRTNQNMNLTYASLDNSFLLITGDKKRLSQLRDNLCTFNGF
mmetsp:Transcript_1573/g.3193  ORF Transcript_1573/g.3193 Transcript_1573/m.3193 type:complete len:338 (-) Transcript_1573:212-1225(-)